MKDAATSPADSAHYSYRVYRKPEIATGFHDSKFGDAIGQLVAARQEAVVHRFLRGGFRDRRILDVGVGSGRVALPLVARGARVVGVDASPLMLAETARRGRDAGEEPIGLATADAHHLPFEAGAFDAVLCFRVLMHVVDWKGALAELARVTRDELIIDVPSRTSFAQLDPWLKRVFGHDEQIYRTFGVRGIRRELVKLGFEVEETHRDFVLPFALHRKIGSPRFTTVVEGAFAKLGLNRLFGGPITIRACVARLGGMAELVTPGEHGVHFAPGDAADLARVLGELIDDPSSLDACYRTGQQPPTLDAMHERVIELYARVLTERAAR